ncbi:hypothetical protein CE91St41_20450 [Oscillospiraceae bacterium]|nr:hypothetical protein CE91St40_17070 [Oscillospiraceae bacterium]BDF75156.1 hypothetical protein CE91St41_20450 [Oscillospiraceae bacterium]
MQVVFLRVAVLSLTCSAVLLPLLLLSPRLRSRYAARTCYFLWLLLALRLLIPVQLSLPRAQVTVEAPVYTLSLPAPAAGATDTVGTAGGPAVLPGQAAPGGVEPAAPVHRTVSLTGIAAAVWLAVGGIFLLWQLLSYAAARRALLRAARPAEEGELALLETLRRSSGIRRAVGLFRTGRIGTPMMLGLLRPVILLPERPMSGGELEVVLRHELAHLRRGDVAYKGLMLLCNAVHWFNPLVWLMAREAGRNLEYCCDDDVVRDQDGAFRRRYGEILLETAAGGSAPAFSTRFGGGKGQLKGRLANLFQHKKNSILLVCMVLVLALAAGSLVACEAGGGKALTGEQALDALEESLSYSGGTLAFTLPERCPAEDLSIQIAGRQEAAGMGGMSWHADTPEDWEAGKAYQITIPTGEDAHFTELTMSVSLPDAERDIDLLPLLDMENVAGGNGDSDIEALMKGAAIRESLESLDEITDAMVSGETIIGFRMSGGESPLENGFSYKVQNFTGVIWNYTIRADTNIDVELNYLTDFPEGQFKAAVVTAEGKVIYLENDAAGKTVTLSLPAGDNVVTMVGYRAEGEFRIRMMPRDGVVFQRWGNGFDNLVPPVQGRASQTAQNWIWPVASREVLEPFSAVYDSGNEYYFTGNNGVDLSVQPGEPVQAAADGTVAATGESGAGLGYSVTLQHADGYVTYYLGLSGPALLSPGSQVKQGDTLGTVGDDARLHFEVQRHTQDAWTLYDPVALILEGDKEKYVTAATNTAPTTDQAWTAAQAWLDEQVQNGPSGNPGYAYLEGRIESLEFAGSVNGYSAYEFDYKFRVDRPENAPVAGSAYVEDGDWVHDYPMVAYLMFRGDECLGVAYEDLGPGSIAFWDETITYQTTEERCKTVAMAAVELAGGLADLESGAVQVDSSAPLTRTAEELSQGTYSQQYPTAAQSVTFYPVEGRGDIDPNGLLGTYYYFFGKELGMGKFNALLHGTDAPYHIFDGKLYQREGAAFPAPVRTVDWSAFAVTAEREDGFDFTLSGAEDGAARSWDFSLEQSNRDGTGYAWRFYTWFGES